MAGTFKYSYSHLVCDGVAFARPRNFTRACFLVPLESLTVTAVTIDTMARLGAHKEIMSRSRQDNRELSYTLPHCARLCT